MTRRSARAEELEKARTPFVYAVVVRAESPTSARVGDDAIILADGSIDGFVGGQCAEESVRRSAMRALDGGEAVLLRVLPEGNEVFPSVPGADVVVNPCLSGGALEIFLEPRIPAPVIGVIGATPIGEAVTQVARSVGYEASPFASFAATSFEGATAVVIATLGHDEAESIRAALDAGVRFVGLVASEKRGGALLDAMELSPEERALVHTPAGLVIGAETPGEIALSIVGEIVKAIRMGELEPVVAAGSGIREAVDPICGMTVVVTSATPHKVVDGVEQWYCCIACRDR